MRQSDGADLPGANTPPNAETGIIYVSPDDARESLLEAILTQDRRGRQRIALVLPAKTSNKALSRPTDFDGLKGLRRDLEAQLVIIAPAGSSPAELARQRRFPVYPDLDAFARSLREAEPEPEGAGSRSPQGAVPQKEEPEAAPAAQTPPAGQEQQTKQAPLPETDDGQVGIPLIPVPEAVQQSAPEPAPTEQPVPPASDREEERIILIPSPPRVPPSAQYPVPVSATTPVRVGAALTASGWRRRRWWLALALVLLVLLVGLLVFQPLQNLIFVPKAILTITPASAVLKNTSLITAVVGKPDPARAQVQARLLYAASRTLQKTVNASGVAQTPATQASGMVTFYNPSPLPRTVPAGTVLLGASGIPVVTDADVTVPASVLPATGLASVPAHAVNAGASGNIPANDLDAMTCCGSPALLVSNMTAFIGGEDAQAARYVEQSDIDGASATLTTFLTASTRAALVKQVQPGEALVASPGCVPLVSSDHAAGERTDAVTVSVAVTCTGEVFDQQAASALAQNLLVAGPAAQLGTAYAPVGHLVTHILHTAVGSQDVVTLNVLAEGTWVYQFGTAQLASLRGLVVGKSQQKAQTLLLQQRGVQHTSIQLYGWNGSTLPSDPTQIEVYVLSVSGM